jgi:hypothetical protein
MRSTCTVLDCDPVLTVESAPDREYLVALGHYEDTIVPGEIIFKDEDELYILGGLDGYNDTAEGLGDLPCRLLQAGESFTITMEE